MLRVLLVLLVLLMKIILSTNRWGLAEKVDALPNAGAGAEYAQCVLSSDHT